MCWGIWCSGVHLVMIMSSGGPVLRTGSPVCTCMLSTGSPLLEDPCVPVEDRFFSSGGPVCTC